MAEAIKIAVRVRPFNEKELAANQKLCIEMVSEGIFLMRYLCLFFQIVTVAIIIHQYRQILKLP